MYRVIFVWNFRCGGIEHMFSFCCSGFASVLVSRLVKLLNLNYSVLTFFFFGLKIFILFLWSFTGIWIQPLAQFRNFYLGNNTEIGHRSSSAKLFKPRAERSYSVAWVWFNSNCGCGDRRFVVLAGFENFQLGIRFHGIVWAGASEIWWDWEKPLENWRVEAWSRGLLLAGA